MIQKSTKTTPKKKPQEASISIEKKTAPVKRSDAPAKTKGVVKKNPDAKPETNQPPAQAPVATVVVKEDVGYVTKLPKPLKPAKQDNEGSPSSQFLTSDEEKAIILRVQAGDNMAFEELANAYKQKAYYVAFNLVKNHEDALDLSQDAFVKAFKAIKSFDINAMFFPWFYKIIRNHCLNHIKKNQRIRNDSLEEMEEETYVQFEDTKPKPRDQFNTDETCTQLWRAIEQLKPDFREIITLKHFHNLSYKEIAEALDIPIGTVMSRLFNARQELRDLVKKYDQAF